MWDRAIVIESEEAGPEKDRPPKRKMPGKRRGG